MKYLPMLLAGAILFATGATQAQTCANPSIMTFNGSGVLLDSTTCGMPNSFTQFCAGADSAEPDVIVRFQVVSPSTSTTITLTPTGAAWDPAIGLLNGACDPNATCSQDTNAGGSGVAETLNVPGPDGVYFLHITASPSSAPSCGAFTLSRNGTPVTLQQYSVE